MLTVFRRGLRKELFMVMALHSSTCKRALCVLALGFFMATMSPGAGGQGSGQSDGSELSGPPQVNPTYQTRDARQCKALTTPPNPAQAAALIQCALETDYIIGLRLMQDVEVEVGAPRSYQPELDKSLKEIDVRAPIYPVSGSLTWYDCGPVDGPDAMYKAGKSCTVSTMPQGNGKCWKTISGGWKCNLFGTTTEPKVGQPGPPTY
jgi:hypothetical protein